ncbi:AraC family transcriptional regulator [Flagellimonas onchidii]|uniref:AraC family transcriptional regulator n=1 Tax=Flagellimonas onchidii TaxID=2562684 RepID=UPI00197A82A9|nr:helix-turn-helix domain-containing protein [Allomuricauda onchidii]
MPIKSQKLTIEIEQYMDQIKVLEVLKAFYRPIQPTVKPENKEILYEEKYPANGIDNFIYCFWQLKSRNTLKNPFVYRVVSDGCIDVFFNHANPSENFVMGFCRKYSEFHLGEEFDYIGIRFLPAVFPILFGTSAKVLSNQSQELNHILPDFSDWVQTTIKQDHSFQEIAGLLNHKLKGLIRERSSDLDLRFFNALHLILEKKGVLESEKNLDTGLSLRQLRRLFNYYLGTTPKAFCNVVRFQYILNSKPSNQSLREDKIYYDVGFHDQAHFIKNFKTFYGITPSEAFR